MIYFLIDENNVITNVIECDDPAVAESLGAVEFNPELDIGDTYEPYVPPETEPEPTLEERVTALEESSTDDSKVWDKLAQAYTEGVQSA